MGVCALGVVGCVAWLVTGSWGCVSHPCGVCVGGPGLCRVCVVIRGGVPGVCGVSLVCADAWCAGWRAQVGVPLAVAVWCLSLVWGCV